MSIWSLKPDLKQLEQLSQGTLMTSLGIEITEIGDDFVIGTMPVDERTFQPMRFLHGGASVALAETLGSFAALLTSDTSQFHIFGQHINSHHLKSVQGGTVKGKATPVHLGKSTQLWNIDVFNDADELIHNSRLTVRIVPKK